MRRISPREAQALLEQGWVYLDVRSESEFAQGHPAGAYNIPLMHSAARGLVPNPDFQQVVEGAFPKDAKLVLGCVSGGRSLRAGQVLEGMGYTQLADQRCGFAGGRDASGRTELGWLAEGLPVESGQPAARSYRELFEQGKARLNG
ncbi:MAG: rhodanese-like domain-containing protein [Myxococcales bacterium]|nr:rhodanese-like domain-containing protein [Myxococcales bacterium]